MLDTASYMHDVQALCGLLHPLCQMLQNLRMTRRDYMGCSILCAGYFVFCVGCCIIHAWRVGTCILW